MGHPEGTKRGGETTVDIGSEMMSVCNLKFMFLPNFFSSLFGGSLDLPMSVFFSI